MRPRQRAAFEQEMAAAAACLDGGDSGAAMRHLERAHVLGQRYVLPHVRSHWAMLRLARRQHTLRDAWGQAVRLLLGALGSMLGWVPLGNTGGTNISMFARLPIDSQLAALMAAPDPSRAVTTDGHTSGTPTPPR